MRCRWEVGKLLQQQNEAKQHFKLNSRIDIHLNDAMASKNHFVYLFFKMKMC